MKKIDIGQMVTILANMGVIAGIVFLTVEIDQNNDQLAAQARYTIYQLRDGLERDYINNEGNIAEIQGRAVRGETLTDVEQNRLSARRFRQVRTYYYMFLESPDGALSEAGYIAAMFQDNPALIATWKRMSETGVVGADFDTFMEERVLPRLNP